MEAKTPKDFFDKNLPARFNPQKAEGVDVTAQVNLTGTNGGNWIVTIRNKKLQVNEGEDPSPTLTITMTTSDFMDLVNDKISVEKAFFSGRVNFEGSLSQALKLRDAGFF